jgi:hypothetical protein
MEQPQRHKDTELEEINKITERIIGCAIEVHRVLQCGLFESLYRSAMAFEFDAAGLTYQREARLLTYLRLARKRVGLLINFNSRLVRDGIKRLIV